MFRFQKVTLANVKFGKILLLLATSIFQELFMNKFDSKASWFDKNCFSEGIYQEKTERGNLYASLFPV